ncbi:hypothetical protein CBM2609_A100403 [Cupriavidus taiwanensis]|nr:hypothetical protein CBM2609_A100403 [Cupriavidus taiwanensis]
MHFLLLNLPSVPYFPKITSPRKGIATHI